jgi:SPP1 family predicted phage head-tail adaptor
MVRNPLRFDRQATILAPTVSRDADGGPTHTFSSAGTRHCHRRDVTSREYRMAEALRSETTAIFTFRYFDGLTALHRIRCENRTYDLSPPKEIGRRRYIEVEAKERIGQ